MGLFDDFSRFLEERLDEYLRDNPHLELMVLEEKLREQEEETLKLMTDLKRQEQQAQDEILALAHEIQLWHVRIQKAKAAGRLDLAEPAQAHEANLLRQGNQKWAHMDMVRQRIKQTQELQQQVQTRRKEVQAKVAQAQATNRTSSARGSASWPSEPNTIPGARNPNLEQQFQRWEAEQELEQLKRDMGGR